MNFSQTELRIKMGPGPDADLSPEALQAVQAYQADVHRALMDVLIKPGAPGEMIAGIQTMQEIIQQILVVRYGAEIQRVES